MTIQYILEIIGTFAFAISGALAAEEKKYDWLGAAFTAFITAIGGGSLRDLLLGSYPLVWIEDIALLYTILAGILFTFFFYRWLIRLKRTLLLFDTFGIALFTIVGTEKALSLGVRPEIAAMMGMFTAVMGGVIRDTLTNETPVLFRTEVYASACLAGAALYPILEGLGVERTTNFIASALLIIVIRLLAVRFHLSLPRFSRSET